MSSFHTIKVIPTRRSDEKSSKPKYSTNRKVSQRKAVRVMATEVPRGATPTLQSAS